MSNQLRVYADGACIHNGQARARGAWAWVAVRDGREVTRQRGVLRKGVATNNRAEMAAAFYACRWLLGQPLPATLVMDSQYVLKGLGEWVPAWKAAGWRKGDGTAVKNVTEWKALWDVYSSIRNLLALEWVPGHAGDRWNDAADRFAGTLLNSRYTPRTK